MSGGVGRNSRPAFDRSLIPRVKSYLKENSHRTCIDIEEMADLLQRTYPDYGRNKKIPFRNCQARYVYEEIIETLEAKNNDTDSDPYETAGIADTPETRQTANESLRSMYSSNRTADDSKIDDIMVIDLLGEQDMAPPQSTQVKKKVVIKRKKVDPELSNELPKVKRLCSSLLFPPPSSQKKLVAMKSPTKKSV